MDNLGLCKPDPGMTPARQTWRRPHASTRVGVCLPASMLTVIPAKTEGLDERVDDG
jgi:hypothetical protein